MEYVEEILTRQRLSTLGRTLGFFIDTYFKDLYYSEKIKENQIAVIKGKLWASGVKPYPLRGKVVRLYVDGNYKKSTRTSENGEFTFELSAQELGGVGSHNVKIAYETAPWELDKPCEQTITITVERGMGIPGKVTPIRFEDIKPALMVAGAVLTIAIVGAILILKKRA